MSDLPQATNTDRWIDKILNSTFLSKLKALFGITNYQIHYLSANLSSNDSDNADLRFNNLEIGKSYRLTNGLSLFQGAAGITMTAVNGSTALLQTSADIDGGNTFNGRVSDSKVFVASATTIVFSFTGLTSGQVRGNGADETFAQLEELPNHVQTTKWD